MNMDENHIGAINDRPYIFPKIISSFQCAYCNKICTAGAMIIILQAILFPLRAINDRTYMIFVHIHHLFHYNTNRQRKQRLCRNFMLTNSPLRITLQSFFKAKRFRVPCTRGAFLRPRWKPEPRRCVLFRGGAWRDGTDRYRRPS